MSYDEPDEGVAQAALDRAIDDSDSLVLVYQPIHDARTGEIYSTEALLRQRRESGELREASIISHTAERSDDLFELTSLLVQKAFTDAASWQAVDFPNVRLNVNLSPREFQEGAVEPRLTGLITSCGIDTRKLNLEITETSYIDEPEETVEVLTNLKKLGAELWLDDFGTGYSSLTHVQHFPLDGLKLPGAFVRGIFDEDGRCKAIVRSLITLSHDLGLKVIAEEVETQEQLDFLLGLDCDYIQGFLFSRPMPLEQFLDALQASNDRGVTPGRESRSS